MLILWNSFLGLGDALVSFLLLIDSKIYWAFAKLYSFYIKLASVELFETDAFSNVLNNVYIIFGVVALFLISFVLLQEMIKTDDSKSGKQVKDVIVRFVLILMIVVLLPTIFGFLYDFQNAIFTQGTIQKILFNTSSTTNKAYITDGNNNYVFTDDCNASSYEEALLICDKATYDISEDYFTQAGYEMGYTVLNGFLSPANGLADNEVKTDASKFMNLDKGLKITGISCAVGGGLATIAIVGLEIFTSPATGFATLAAIPGTLTAFAGTIGTSCLVGAGIGAVGSYGTYLFTYDEYKWSDAKLEIISEGNFDRITSFADQIIDGNMDYTPILSTIAGLIMLYMIFSFCLDLGVRAAKLAFLEALAPICLLLGILPSKKDLITNWFKKVGTIYMEVFIRIFSVCGVAYLITKLNQTVIGNLGLLAKAIIVLGLVIFVKQLPKFISDITGLKSENMKLGIKEKLAEGGAFTAGAVIGGGATAFARNAVHAGKSSVNKFKDIKGKTGKDKRKATISAIGSIFTGVGSTIAGTTSAQARSFKAGAKAKSFGDMKSAASTGAKKAVEARDKRATYKSRHGNTVSGAALGHIGDTIQNVGKWLDINNVDSLIAENKIIEGIQSLRKAIDTEASQIILDDLQKGKTNVSYNTQSHNMVKLRELKNKVDEIRNMTDSEFQRIYGATASRAAEISKAEVNHSSYLKGWQDELSNMALQGTAGWESLSNAQKADLAKLRMATNSYRESVAKQINLPYIAALNGATDILDASKDLSVNHDLLSGDGIKASLKLRQVDIKQKIDKARLKEEEKKGNQ